MFLDAYMQNKRNGIINHNISMAGAVMESARKRMEKDLSYVKSALNASYTSSY